jgi:hypothetical protein
MYGYGHVYRKLRRHPAYYHPGDNPGYQSFAGWIPDRAPSIVPGLCDVRTPISSPIPLTQL